MDTKHWGLESGVRNSLCEPMPTLKAGGHGKAGGTQVRDEEGLSEPLGIPVPRRFHLPRASVKNKMPSVCGCADSGLGNG